MVDFVQYFYQFIVVCVWLYLDKIFIYRGDKYFVMFEVFFMKYVCVFIQQGVIQMEIIEVDERYIFVIQQIYVWYVLYGIVIFEIELFDVVEMIVW